jgi:hypothetical protein
MRARRSKVSGMMIYTHSGSDMDGCLNPEGGIKVQIGTMVVANRSLHWLVLTPIQSFRRGVHELK